jgi:carboxymethylenebutenolidase
MCDNFTTRADEAALSRRTFTTAGALTAMATLTGASRPAAPRLREGTVSVSTPDGSADCFFVHPARGKHPGVILWPDIGGNRDAFKVMARRLAGAGYAVLVFNQYYRGGTAPVLATFAEWRTPEGQTKLKPMIATLTPEGTMRDAAAAVAFLDKQPAVNRQRGIGTQGYCMGGPHAVRTAAAAPARIKAVASFHGGGLASDKPDSPHLLLARTQARYLIAVARNDDARDAGEKDRFRIAADAASRPAEIAVYGADHGWCVPDSPVYNQAEADKAWERLLALYEKL